MRRQGLANWLGRAALVVLAVGVLCATARTGALMPVQAGGARDRKDRVTVTATAEKPGADGTQKVTVVVEADDGWYAHANPVNNEEFANLKTEIKVGARGKIEKVQVNYPPGKVKMDKVVGAFNIYEGKVAIPLVVQRTKGDGSPLEVSVQLNICSHKFVCLPVQQAKLTLP